MKPAIEIMRERAASAVGELVARVPAGVIRAAFAGGSVGRGEVWSASRNGALEIFSDIDLYVVISEDADEALVRRTSADVASTLPAAGEGVVFRRGADIGVYRWHDLLAQPVRPGTADLAEHHLWLFGDPSLVADLARALSRPMERSEALYLLENRAWDLLETEPETSAATSAKVMLDVLAAHLIAEGRFVPTYQRRREADDAQPVRLTSSAARAAVDAAERFRRGETQVMPGGALSLVAEAWSALGASILFGAGTSADAIAVLSARCARGRRFANYREFVRSRHRLNLSLLSAASAGLGFTALSPNAALRTHAVVRGLFEAGRATAEACSFHSGYVARLSSRVAPAEATLDRRVRAAMKASG
ncbi:MAG TPA: hypothetical protein VFU38_02720 [Candidatus Krumholzibacteria bacterium]|nr:hypothetical protein [Candidatus Krumholzibacteria bacterium]